ncbi:MAG: DUF1440 domain-containing protein [Chloroflexia bacterium]
MSRKQQNPVVGAFCGLVGGVAASAVMDVYWKVVKETLGERPEQKPKGKNDGQKEEPPSTQVVADKFSQALTGKEVSKKDKAKAGIGVHYATGLFFGALFGIAAALRPRLGVIGGLFYGAAIWATLDEVGLRVLGIAPDPGKVPPIEHAQAFGAHLAYGSSTAIFTRLLLKLLGGRPLREL